MFNMKDHGCWLFSLTWLFICSWIFFINPSTKFHKIFKSMIKNKIQTYKIKKSIGFTWIRESKDQIDQMKNTICDSNVKIKLLFSVIKRYIKFICTNLFRFKKKKKKNNWTIESDEEHQHVSRLERIWWIRFR